MAWADMWARMGAKTTRPPGKVLRYCAQVPVQRASPPDLPSLHICCSLLGLPLAGVQGPYSVSADANLPDAFINDRLSRHTPANVFPVTQCLNWLKGSAFSDAELAAAALFDRAISNLGARRPDRQPAVRRPGQTTSHPPELRGGKLSEVRQVPESVAREAAEPLPCAPQHPPTQVSWL